MLPPPKVERVPYGRISSCGCSSQGSSRSLAPSGTSSGTPTRRIPGVSSSANSCIKPRSARPRAALPSCPPPKASRSDVSCRLSTGPSFLTPGANSPLTNAHRTANRSALTPTAVLESPRWLVSLPAQMPAVLWPHRPCATASVRTGEVGASVQPALSDLVPVAFVRCSARATAAISASRLPSQAVSPQRRRR